MSIKRRETQYIGADSSGKKILGKHKAKKGAEKQFRAIGVIRRKRKGKR